MPDLNGQFRVFPAVLFLAGLSFTLNLAAQVKSDCTLRGVDTVLTTGETVKKCLDVASLDGKTMVIPSNVVKIDKEGFSLCERSKQEGGLTDITYIMDQSGSMQIKYIWISPDQADTVMLYGTNGCTGLTNGDFNNFGKLTVLQDAGTVQVNKINPAKTPTGCTDFAGDPYGQRAIAFKQAIDFQAARAPNSTASFLGFHQTVSNPVRPLVLNTVANVNAIKSKISPQYQNSTNYRAPLDSAKSWLLNPTIAPNSSKAIIFLSDGRPTYPTNNPDSYLDVLSPTYSITPGVMPPVYGIFLGHPNEDTLRLAQMSVSTGGKFFLIPPDRPDSLKTVVANILNIILRQYQPNRSTITNSSLVPPQTAMVGPGGFIRQSDGSWLMNLDQQVGLTSMASNQIGLTTELKETNTGTLTPNAANFLLSTTGLTESTNKNLPGLPFSVVCRELPPDINKVKVAYIRDMDGDGAGDMVFFEFTRPLTALPTSIDSIYWNQVGVGFINRGIPKLSFLIGSSNTVVMADLAAAPYPKGLTFIPPGAAPYGVLPQGGVLLGQRPAINDSIGPILDSGIVHPFNIAKASTTGGLNLDTLLIYVSEPMISDKTWEELLLFSKPVNGQCTDFEHALPVVPYLQPVQDPGKKKFTIIVAAGQGGPTPVSGDCIYLNVNGTYRDVPKNIPPVLGTILKGKNPERQIELFRGYPPVAGITAENPSFIMVNNDPRTGTDIDYSKMDATSGRYVTTWIPPVGYAPGVPFDYPVPSKSDALSVGTDPETISPLPKGIGTVQVVSTGKYIATVNIFDNNGNFVKTFKQAFGYQGELNNRLRITNKGLASYLIWDLKDLQGQKAGQGVFIWKVVFRFENNKEEIQYTKTGVVRQP